jgi:peroxiredoxin-like protein
MSDLAFEAAVIWRGPAGERRGTVETGGQTVGWSVPSSMGGLGEGTSPEELLLAAVGTCYSATLGGALRQAKLPAGEIRVRVEGLVSGHPASTRYERITVSPRIAGGDAGRVAQYRQAAEAARDRCFIGAIVRSQVEYAVGEVEVA